MVMQWKKECFVSAQWLDLETRKQHNSTTIKKKVLDDNCHCNFFGWPLLLCTVYHTEYFWCGKYTLKTNTIRNRKKLSKVNIFGHQKIPLLMGGSFSRYGHQPIASIITHLAYDHYHWWYTSVISQPPDEQLTKSKSSSESPVHW